MNIGSTDRSAHQWKLADSDTRVNADGSVAHLASAKKNAVRIGREALDIVNPTSVLIPAGNLVKTLLTPPDDPIARIFFALIVFFPMLFASVFIILGALIFEFVEVAMLPLLMAKDALDIVVHLFASIGKPAETAPALDNSADGEPFDMKIPSSIQPFVAFHDELAKAKTLSALNVPQPQRPSR